MLVARFDNGFAYGIIPGKDSFIITEPDFVHWVRDNGASETLTVGYNKTEGESNEEGWSLISVRDIEKTFTLTELLALAVETPLGHGDDHFGHYWGIKSRVAYNYHLLLGTMGEIGADASKMPKWGEE